jgi:meso-butanediol dehydrogenase/(S,S)-butanediol dehydrogenase/diacetyl reductase
MPDMEGTGERRSALVTGAGSGIGEAVARRLAAEGYDLILMGRRPGPLERVANATGGTPVAGDAADAEAVREACGIARKRRGGLDVVVMSAGGAGTAALLDTDDAAFERAIHSNLQTAFVTARETLPHLQARRGAIVVVSSIAGLAAPPAALGYACAKHALLGLTRSLARDYGPEVRVNAVAPGWVRTPLADIEMDALARRHGLASRDEAYALATRDTPLRRPVEPDEIAAIAVFLASPAASAMTGAVVVADGGATVVDLPTLAFAP